MQRRHLLHILVCSFVFFLMLPCLSYGFNPSTASLEEQLVFLNTETVPSTIDQAKVNRFRFLLDALEKKHTEDRKAIANITSKTQGILRGDGISESLLDIMESMHNIKLDSRLGKTSYLELNVMYTMLRADGMSRPEAVNGLMGLLNGIAQTKK